MLTGLIGFNGGADAWRIRFEIRDQKGTVVKSGETGGAKSWLDNPRFGNQNAIKRVKSALGMKWSVKTWGADGDGDICRRFENNATLHIWIDRDGTTAVSPTVTNRVVASHVNAMATRITSGLMTLDEVPGYIMAIVDEDTFDSVDWRELVDDELTRREIGL